MSSHSQPSQPSTLPFLPAPSQLPHYPYPSILKKNVSIRKENDDDYVHFKFVFSDSKSDIHEEISKWFNMDRFSLRDSEGDLITGSYDSLERDGCYEIIDRSEKRSNIADNLDNSDDTSESISESIKKRKEPAKFINRAFSIIPPQPKRRKTYSSQNSADNNIGKSIIKKKSLPKACSRCRQIKKRCDRQRPCGRCVKSSLTHSCDAGEEQN